MSVLKPLGNAKHGDYAHIPGEGPKGQICKDCIFFDTQVPRTPANKGRCRKAAQMRRDQIKAMKPIEAMSRACKYWERD